MDAAFFNKSHTDFYLPSREEERRGFDSREWVSTSGLFIGPYIRRECWSSSQEADVK